MLITNYFNTNQEDEAIKSFQRYAPQMRDLLSRNNMNYKFIERFNIDQVKFTLKQCHDFCKCCIDAYQKIKLKKIFIPNSKIGIYGVGSHTGRLLETYRKLFGEIKSTIYYFDSNYEKIKKYEGKPVYGPNQLNEFDLDRIIISSYSFQEEIYDILRNIIYDSNKLLKIYSQNDFYVFSDKYD